MATRKNPHISLDSAMGVLTSTMQNPMNANIICAIRIGLAAGRIEQELEACTTIAARIRIAKSYPNFLRAGIKFLTFNQHLSDHVAMVNHLILCQCDLSRARMRNLHNPSQYGDDDPLFGCISLFEAVATVSNCIILALADSTQHKFRNASSKQNYWPRGPEDLLPYGPKKSLIGLELWVTAPPFGHFIFKLAGSLASFYAPFAQEVFQLPYSTFALVRPIQHLEAAVAFYDEDNSSFFTHPIRAVSEFFRTLGQSDRARFISFLVHTSLFAYPVKAVFEFFHALGECDRSRFNIMIIAHGHWILPILARLTTILSRLPMEWSETRTQVQFLTALVNIDPVTRSIILSEHELSTRLPSLDALEGAFDEIVGIRKRGCCNITCSSASQAAHSQLCHKCDLIRFCGKKVSVCPFPSTHCSKHFFQQCRKEAWGSSTLPHKDVCPKIHSLKDSLGAADWSLIWTPDFTYAQFQDMCITKKVDIEFVKDIGNTISALRMCTSMFQEDLKRAGVSQIDHERRAEADRLAWEDLMNDLGPESASVFNRQDVFLVMSGTTIDRGGTIRRDGIGRGNAIGRRDLISVLGVSLIIGGFAYLWARGN